MLTYSEARARLESRASLPLLVGEVWDPALSAALKDARPEGFFGNQPIRNPRLAVAVLAGLLLWNDDFNGSHLLARGLDDATGSYWHGLCHRREGHSGRGLESNLANARYWFRQMGTHPAFPAVYEAALAALDGAGAGMRWATETAAQLRARGSWDPFAIIDWVAQVEAGSLSAATRALVEEIQRREIAVLLDWCRDQAVGGH